MSGIQVLSGDFVNVRVTGTASDFTSEKRFAKGMTIFELKSKLELVTGCSCATMTLELYDKDDRLVCVLADNDSMLGAYPVDDNMRIHANDPASAGAFDFSGGDGKPLYVMSDEEYRQKSDTFLQFKRNNKLAEFAPKDPEEERRRKEAEEEALAEERRLASAMKVGDRCEVRAAGQAPRRGVVAFVGEAHFKPGHWVGVRLDEPLGKNDGSVGGRRYFECPAKYGGFFKPKDVVVGDYPELGIDELDEI